MKNRNPKKHIKKKSSDFGPNAAGPNYRTPDHFKGSKFSGGGVAQTAKNQPKFNPSQFKTQHKG